MTAEEMASDMETKLARMETVQGLLDISFQNITLQQQLWVERPNRLRTETAVGPGAFRGVIVVLNENEGWVYSPALTMATVVDRSGYDPDLAGASGAGSMLERVPAAVLNGLRAGYAMNDLGRETVAGRRVRHIELVVPPNDPSFPPGPLHVWLDDRYGYPLGFRDSSARQVMFRSVQFNQSIDPLTFVFFPPPSAQVQRVETTP
jgi:outer membrane lipoprotein-sorting protein